MSGNPKSDWMKNLLKDLNATVRTEGESMCRNIKQLRNAEIPASEEEIRLAARQFVRKVSGYRKPSMVNEEAFERAVEDVARATQILLEALRQPVKST